MNVLLSGSLIGTFVFYNSKKRQQAAQANQQEVSAESVAIQNLQQSLAEWKGIAEAREEKLNKRDETIDRLYLEKSDDRRVQHSQASQINQLGIELSNAKVRVCNVRACEDRNPPSEIF